MEAQFHKATTLSAAQDAGGDAREGYFSLGQFRPLMNKAFY